MVAIPHPCLSLAQSQMPHYSPPSLHFPPLPMPIPTNTIFIYTQMTDILLGLAHVDIIKSQSIPLKRLLRNCLKFTEDFLNSVLLYIVSFTLPRRRRQSLQS
jgi:hypothetical protein